jgi:hypothetical protein
MSQYVARAVADAYERNSRAHEFFLLVRSSLMGRGQQWEMLGAASNLKAPDRVKQIITGAMAQKAAVDALSLAEPGADIAPY